MSYILVVDDDGPLCGLLEMMLTGEGYEVQIARTASQAVDFAQQRQPALVLFDMWMPNGGGEGFVTAYRALPGASARLIAVSGIANLEAEAARIGAHGFLQKPFELDDLLDIAAQSLTEVGDTA